MVALKVVAALCVVLVCGVAADFKNNEIFEDIEEEKAPPKPCCMPATFEGSMSVIAGERIRWHNTAAFGNCTFHFDMKNKRVATETTMYRGKRRIDVNVIESVADNAMYIIFPKWQKCKKARAAPLSNCLPKEAKFVGDATMGGVGAPNFPVRTFGLKIGNLSVYSLITVTQAKCVPVSALNMGQVRRVKFTELESYFNMKVGIKDAKVFTVPDICKKAEFEPLSEELKPYTEQHQSVMSFLRN